MDGWGAPMESKQTTHWYEITVDGTPQAVDGCV